MSKKSKSPIDKTAKKQTANKFKQPYATLVFPLPDYEGEFQDAQNGYNYKRVLQDLDNEMRNAHKHGTGLRAKYAFEWRERIRDLLGEYGVDLL
jgi:hypothetical protein